MTGIEEVPPERSMPRDRKEAIRGLLVEEISRPAPWWRRSGRSMTIGTGVVALVLVGGGAAAAYVAFKPVSNPNTVQCYAAASRDAASTVPQVAVAKSWTEGEPAVTEPVPVSDPVKACQVLWDYGILRPDSTKVHQPENPAEVRPGNPAGTSRRAPRLVACTLDEGVAGVFPGDASTCERLGLPRTTPDRS
ncbi:MAG TPA: hypothetical protein VI076_08785 [Actinopolymorphaceae bacterium]